MERLHVGRHTIIHWPSRRSSSQAGRTRALSSRLPQTCPQLGLVLVPRTGDEPAELEVLGRRDRVGHGTTVPNYTDLERAIDYIQKNDFIREVILTGGDPLILSDTKLKFLVHSLNKISHLNNLRIHTRVPIASPGRITSSLLRVLQTELPIWIALHCNHPREFGQEAQTACKRLIDSGLPMVSQSVLLKGVNNDVEVLTELMRILIKLKIKPYYIHHPDRAPGTSHFQITIEEGLSIVEGLRGTISGLCQPTYVLDIPGGYGKTPLTRENVVANNLGWTIRDYKGQLHFYPRT